MTLARQERHKAGRYPIVNTAGCSCPAGWAMLFVPGDRARIGPHHWSGGTLDANDGGGYWPRCPLFRMPQCGHVFRVPPHQEWPEARQCSMCGRRSASAERWESCDMPQPSGERCHGVFQ